MADERIDASCADSNRVCSICGVEKPISRFRLDRGKRRTDCRDCCKSRKKEYYVRNKARIKGSNAAYYAANRERLAEYGKGWRERNQEKLSSYERARAEEKADRHRERKADPEYVDRRRRVYHELLDRRRAEKGLPPRTRRRPKREKEPRPASLPRAKKTISASEIERMKRTPKGSLKLGIRVCVVCEKELPIENFDRSMACDRCRPGYDAARKLKYRESYKRWVAQNKERLRRMNKKWKSQNAEKLAEKYAEKARQTAAEVAERRKIRRVEQKRKWANDPPEKKRKRDYQRKWRAENPEKNDAGLRRYRANKRNASASEPYNALDIAKRDNWRCHICGKRVKRNVMSMDHLTPLSQDGDDTPRNVALAHRSCNSRRGPGRLPAQLRLFG